MKDAWVKVRDEGELRAGMAVQMRPCDACLKTETAVLLGSVAVAGNVWWRGRLVPSVSRSSWTLAGHCSSCTVQFGHEIANGELYRLADDQLTDLSETRELETVR